LNTSTTTDLENQPGDWPPATVTPRAARLRGAVDEFVEQEVRPRERQLAVELATRESPRPELEPDGKMAAAVWEARREVQRRSAQAGFYALHLPTEIGGGGLTRSEMFVIEEAVYRHGVGLAPAMLAWTEGPSPMLAYANEQQRKRFVAPLIRAETTTAFANTEPGGGSDVLGMRTSARRDGSDWILSGRKAWITNAPFCDLAQVVAVTEPGAGSRSLTAFFVEVDRPGFSRGPVAPTIMDDGLTGELWLDDVRVPDSNRLGDVGQGLALAMTFINWRRMCRGGMCAGWTGLLIDRAVARVRSRQAFGGPLADRQVVQHMLAEMQADHYSARATSILAQAELDALGPHAIPLADDAKGLISLIKLVNDQAFFRIADRAIQLHGASGLRRNSIEEKLFRVARNLRIPAGADEIQRNQIARQLLVRDTASTTADQDEPLVL
jgi:alkylation response protein AidB-like acyl-CoA dehydrogenase